jgi:hypothetical protein
MDYKEYNRKGFLLPDSIRSCASFHAKIMPTGEYLFRIHDCIGGVRLRGDLNKEDEVEEACEKLITLSVELLNFAKFIQAQYGK